MELKRIYMTHRTGTTQALLSGWVFFIGVFCWVLFFGGEGIVREMRTHELAANFRFVAVVVSAAGTFHGRVRETCTRFYSMLL